MLPAVELAMWVNRRKEYTPEEWEASRGRETAYFWKIFTAALDVIIGISNKKEEQVCDKE